MSNPPSPSRFSWPALPSFPLPAFLAAMDAPQRHLTLAIGASLLLHAVVLTIRFTPPDFIDKARERALDVILVNSKSKNRPDKAQAKAQTNLDGGGNTDADLRAKTPLPPSPDTKEGRELIEAQRRVAELEAQQQQQMTRLKSERAVATNKTQNNQTAPPEPTRSGADLASSALAIARVEGQISRQLEDYNQRPRKKFIGARTEEYRAAQYIEAWREKIQRVGELNYPSAARGRMSGNLVMYVEVSSNGELITAEIQRPSGNKVFDDAALRIVRLAAPFGPFPPELKKETDILAFARTWKFTAAGALHAD
jgi:protein TonB